MQEIKQYKSAVCKGSKAFGSACGSCERCIDEAVASIPKPKMEYGPYKMVIEWLPLTSEEDKAKALEILGVTAKDIDRSADYELTCVQKVTYERV